MKRRHADDLRGATRLAVEATRGITDLVEAMHNRIGAGPDLLGRPLAAPVRFVNGLVYGSVRGVTGLVGAGIDLALAELAPLLGESLPGVERDAIVAVLNGVLGDYLRETKNPLAIESELRRGGRRLALDAAGLRAALGEPRSRVVVLVHGSSMSDLGFSRAGHDHGAALERDGGFSSVYAHYNSGLHISTNGAELSALLEALVAAWPAPVDEVVLVGHSMGGLVARSACHAAEAAGHAWRAKLTKLVSLGSPHQGAPLERGGNWLDFLLGVSSYSAPLARLGKIRSAGVTDLRFGNVLDEHWQGRDRFELGRDRRTKLALPSGVDCYAVAGTTSADGPGGLLGDGLVPVESALGRHRDPALDLGFPPDHQCVVTKTGHLDLLSSPEVYAQLAAWLGAPAPARPTR